MKDSQVPCMPNGNRKRFLHKAEQCRRNSSKSSGLVSLCVWQLLGCFDRFVCPRMAERESI